MLSYQHAYHAGNLADVHKHAALAWVLDYLTQKDKPLTYLETHAGRGLYDLGGVEAAKTGEAAQGITRAESAFPPDHPYRQVLDRVRAKHGAAAYPGSPLIAAMMLRPDDMIHLAELHPQEHAALLDLMLDFPTLVHKVDGLSMALSRTPPDPRRGLMLIDPSYEIKTDYETLPGLIRAVHRKWNVGTLIVWYPILHDGRHRVMTADLLGLGLRHEVQFPPAKAGHGMIGSGLFVVNPPWGLADELKRIATRISG